jgi:hypothetical protein
MDFGSAANAKVLDSPPAGGGFGQQQQLGGFGQHQHHSSMDNLDNGTDNNQQQQPVQPPAVRYQRQLQSSDMGTTTNKKFECSSAVHGNLNRTVDMLDCGGTKRQCVCTCNPQPSSDNNADSNNDSNSPPENSGGTKDKTEERLMKQWI